MKRIVGGAAIGLMLCTAACGGTPTEGSGGSSQDPARALVCFFLTDDWADAARFEELLAPTDGRREGMRSFRMVVDHGSSALEVELRRSVDPHDWVRDLPAEISSHEALVSVEPGEPCRFDRAPAITRP